MPIYAYRCERCGHAKDVLQKVSDPVLTVCPACGEPAFRKQVTAAGFQLKGSGWYVTDFRGDGKAQKKAEGSDAAAGEKAGAEKPADVPTPAADAPAATAGESTVKAGDAGKAASAPAPAPVPAKPAD